MNPKIAIILVNYNGIEDTKECLESLQKLNYDNFETVVVDNGSKDDSVKILKEKYPEIQLIDTGKNLGFSEGNNVALKKCLKKNFSYFFLLNNDTVVDRDLLTHLVNAAEKHPNAGILGTKILRYHDKNTIDHFGGVWNKDLVQFDPIGCGKDINSFTECKVVDYICGCAFFIKRKVLEDIGFLLPEYFLIWEEADYCYKAKEKGYQCLSVPEAKVYHKVSSSFTGGKPQLEYFWWRNRLLWLYRNQKQITFPYKKIVFFQILKTVRHFFIKFISYPLSSRKKRVERRAKVRRYYARVRGIKDYYLNRFGNRY